MYHQTNIIMRPKRKKLIRVFPYSLFAASAPNGYGTIGSKSYSTPVTNCDFSGHEHTL